MYCVMRHPYITSTDIMIILLRGVRIKGGGIGARARPDFQQAAIK